ncbi:peptide chain release factor N(5)-glutamine methyltransferase [Paenibacillus sediminis]|nr:peptide chain release factor N(5)-glutamine methyltransferase [Paenibacillus sediminis]
MTPQTSIREAFVEASSFLEAKGIMEPQRNAEVLLRHVLGMEGAAYYMSLLEPFPMEKRTLWEEVVNRKAAGEPAQYIIGEQEFYGLSFAVNSAVLIPRPETELLVEAVMEHGKRLWPEGSPRVADIGTGSGAIAVTLAHLCPSWHVAASDISQDALEVAKVNAKRNGVNIAFKLGNLLEPFAGENIDILISNPPYIPDEEIEGLQPEVRIYEPRTALAGGSDGLNPYRTMMEQLRLLAAPPKIIGFELGMGQSHQVAELVRSTGYYSEIQIIPDLAGIERHVIGII